MIKIYTDSCSDIPKNYLYNDIEILPLHYYFDNENIEYGENYELSMREYFLKIAEGKKPHTSAVNPDYAIEKFMNDVLEGNQIICICMSSGLSSTYQNVVMAKEDILEDYPDAKITVIDSLTGSLAEGLLVLKAEKLKQERKTYEEIVDYIEKYKTYYQINFYVSDLEYLRKGGRISKTSSTLGTVLGVRPLIHVNEQGKAVDILHTRGIKRCDDILISKLIAELDPSEIIGIVHSSSIESAKRLKRKLDERNFSDNVIIGEISPVIATHIGPNAFGLTYKVKKLKK